MENETSIKVKRTGPDNIAVVAHTVKETFGREKPVCIVEEAHGEGRVAPEDLERHDQLIIVCSEEEAARIKEGIETSTILKNKKVITAEYLEEIEKGTADIILFPHQASYAEQPEMRPMLKQFLDFLHELSAIIKIPVIAKLRGFVPPKYGVRYAELEDTHADRKTGVIENIKERLEHLTQEGRIIFSVGFNPENPFPRYDARKVLKGELVADWEEIQQIVNQAGGRIDYITFGSHDISSPSRIVGAMTNILLTIVGKLPGKSIEGIINSMSRYTMPVTHKLAKGGMTPLNLYTTEQITDLIKSGEFNKVIGPKDRIIVVARKTDAKPLKISST